MNKQILKVWMVVASFAMVLGAASSAQAGQQVVARVPFDFVVKGVRLPAGKAVLAPMPIASDARIISVTIELFRHARRA